MLLYDARRWIHVFVRSDVRRDGFSRGWIEFICTASLFVLTLRWEHYGIAFAWTASFYLLMFPSFWYAGKPIGLGIGSVL